MIKPIEQSRSLATLHARVEACTLCPRLRDWCTSVAVSKKRAFADWDYWGKPVAGFGDAKARLWIIGLAPAAHGANRTGRVFTGDRSGDFLFAALHRTGYASQPTSIRASDGLKLTDCYISATARCAPPANKPTPVEVSRCAPFLDEEFRLLRRKRVILALGGIAWTAALALSSRMGCEPSARVSFAHGAEVALSQDLTLIGSYHVSQQNTFTGRLTERMFDQVLERCRAICEAAR